jgi:hypothetical protein
VASRYVADCKRHGQDREAERQSDSREAIPRPGKAAASTALPRGIQKSLPFRCQLHACRISLSN